MTQAQAEPKLYSFDEQDLRTHTIYSVLKICERSLMNSNDHYQKKCLKVKRVASEQKEN